jgi:hypothetical protein
MTNTRSGGNLPSLPFLSFAADVAAAAASLPFPFFSFPLATPMLVMTINNSASCLPPSTLLHMRADPSLELELYMHPDVKLISYPFCCILHRSSGGTPADPQVPEFQ